MRIEGRTALVTGANRGLGLAFVRGLLDRGAAKVYAAARDPGALGEGPGDRVGPVRVDVPSATDRAAVVSSCGDTELLVSNAGLSPTGPVLESDEAVIRETFEVNV